MSVPAEFTGGTASGEEHVAGLRSVYVDAVEPERFVSCDRRHYADVFWAQIARPHGGYRIARGRSKSQRCRDAALANAGCHLTGIIPKPQRPQAPHPGD